MGGFAAALVAFAVAAATLVALLFGLALAVARAQEQTVERLGAAAPAVRRWGGRVLVAVGLWFVLLGVFAGFFAELFPV